jgi:hypothetical protein
MSRCGVASSFVAQRHYHIRTQQGKVLFVLFVFFIIGFCFVTGSREETKRGRVAGNADQRMERRRYAKGEKKKRINDKCLLNLVLEAVRCSGARGGACRNNSAQNLR